MAGGSVQGVLLHGGGEDLLVLLSIHTLLSASTPPPTTTTGNAPAKKAAPAPASDSGTPKAKPTKQTTFQDPPVSGEVPPVKEKQPKAVKEEGEPSGAKDTEDYKLGKHSRSNSNPSTFGTSSYGATPMQMRSKDSSKGDKGDKGGWGKRLLSKS